MGAAASVDAGASEQNAQAWGVPQSIFDLRERGSRGVQGGAIGAFGMVR